MACCSPDGLAAELALWEARRDPPSPRPRARESAIGRLTKAVRPKADARIVRKAGARARSSALGHDEQCAHMRADFFTHFVAHVRVVAESRTAPGDKV